MKKTLYQILLIIFFSLSLCFHVFAQTNQTEDKEISDKLSIAFERLKKADYSHSWRDELKPYGKKVLPYMEKYFDKEDDSIKFVILSFIEDIKEPETISILLKALKNSEWLMSERGAVYLHDNYDHKMLSQRADIGEALRQNVVAETASLTTIVLLGYFPGEETEKALFAAKPTKTFGFWTTTKNFYAPVKYPVPVALSLYRINPQAYAEKLATLIKKANYGETEFLLYSLNYIDDRELLKLIFEKGIKNTRMRDIEVGIHGEIFPNSMRVIDLTVYAFAQKFNINPGFKIEERRYSKSKISILSRKIIAELNTRQ